MKTIAYACDRCGEALITQNTLSVRAVTIDPKDGLPNSFETPRWSAELCSGCVDALAAFAGEARRAYELSLSREEKAPL